MPHQYTLSSTWYSMQKFWYGTDEVSCNWDCLIHIEDISPVRIECGGRDLAYEWSSTRAALCMSCGVTFWFITLYKYWKSPRMKSCAIMSTEDCHQLMPIHVWLLMNMGDPYNVVKRGHWMHGMNKAVTPAAAGAICDTWWLNQRQCKTYWIATQISTDRKRCGSLHGC